MNDKISSYFPPPSPPDPPKKPSMASPPPPDEPKKSKRPAKHSVLTYDYGRVCNYEKCEKQTVECSKCLNDLVNRDGKSRLGHITITIKIPWEETETHIKARVVVYHGHFALIKGTQVPAFDVARNACCDLGWKWLDKKYAYLSWRVERDKPLPAFALSDE